MNGGLQQTARVLGAVDSQFRKQGSNPPTVYVRPEDRDAALRAQLRHIEGLIADLRSEGP